MLIEGKANLKKYAILLTVLIIASIMVLGFLIPSHGTNLSVSQNMPLNDSASQLATPIRINSNADMAADAVTYCWSGNGTPDDPFIITNVNIDSYWGTYGIFIENTNCSLIIDSATFSYTIFGSNPYYTGAAVTLYNVSNAVVQGSGTYTDHIGLYVQDCSNITLSGNSIGSSDYCGIYICSSNNVTISNNYISNSGQYGIQIESSPDVNISGNTISSINSFDGILLDSSENDLIANNTISSACSSSIHLVSSNDDMINDNQIYPEADGMKITTSSDDVIGRNLIDGGYGNGIWLDHSENMTLVQDQVLSNSNTEIYSTSTNVTIIGCQIIGGENGVWMDHTANMTLIQDQVQSSYIGIYSTSLDV